MGTMLSVAVADCGCEIFAQGIIPCSLCKKTLCGNFKKQHVCWEMYGDEGCISPDLGAICIDCYKLKSLDCIQEQKENLQ